MVNSKEASAKKVDSKKVDLKVDLKKGKTKSKTSKALSINNIDLLIREYELPEEGLTPTIILHKMSETLELYLKLIQQILQPEEFHAVYECNAFNDTDKAGLFDLYKRLIITHRELLKAVILCEDKTSIATIQFVHEEIQGVKKQMLEIVEKMQQSWKTDSSKDKQKGTKQYFG